MIGPRIGPRVGPRVGGAVGVGADQIGSVGNGVPQDGPSSWYVPASSANFTALGITVPNSLWPCQEAAGNLADSIGSLTLIAAGGPSYQQAMPAGWSRKGVGGVSAAGKRFAAAAASGPDPATTSSLWLFYTQVTAVPGAARSWIMATDNAANAEARTDAGGHARCTCNAVDVNGASSFGTTLVRPWLLMFNRAASTVVLYTDQEKIPGTYAAGLVDGNKGIGASAIASLAALACWGCMWSGANAERTDAQNKTMLQALNISIPWT